MVLDGFSDVIEDNFIVVNSCNGDVMLFMFENSDDIMFVFFVNDLIFLNDSEVLDKFEMIKVFMKEYVGYIKLLWLFLEEKRVCVEERWMMYFGERKVKLFDRSRGK